MGFAACFFLLAPPEASIYIGLGWVTQEWTLLPSKLLVHFSHFSHRNILGFLRFKGKRSFKHMFRDVQSKKIGEVGLLLNYHFQSSMFGAVDKHMLDLLYDCKWTDSLEHDFLDKQSLGSKVVPTGGLLYIFYWSRTDMVAQKLGYFTRFPTSQLLMSSSLPCELQQRYPAKSGDTPSPQGFAFFLMIFHFLP